MTRKKDEAVPELPDHPLFTTRRWHNMISGRNDHLEVAFLPPTPVKFDYNSTLSCHRLHACCAWKDYDGELELFLDWISLFNQPMPSGTVVGWSYVDSDFDFLPTMIVSQQGQLLKGHILPDRDVFETLWRFSQFALPSSDGEGLAIEPDAFDYLVRVWQSEKRQDRLNALLCEAVARARKGRKIIDAQLLYECLSRNDRHLLREDPPRVAAG